ncbi:FtsQ-type POTRA domain-containing protein [Rathayibacter sp. CAU 1779]
MDAPRRSEPDADTQPIPVVRSAAVQTSSDEKPSSGSRIKKTPASQTATTKGARKTTAANSASTSAPTVPSTAPSQRKGRSSAASAAEPSAATAPSVRAASRRRRRYERAEVKRFTRAARRRRLAWLIGVGSVVLVLAGAALVSISPAMALRSIDVVGAQRVQASSIREALKDQLGTPLPLIDYGAVRKELAEFPLIRSYSTEADPPGTLVVRIQERTPIALLQIPSGYQLVDQAGVVMQTTAQRPGGYPIVSLPADASESSKRKEFAASAAVLAALPPATLSQVDTATATGSEDVTLKFLTGATVVWGGPEDADLKVAVLAALQKNAPGASVYDVSSPKSPVIR